MKKIVVLTLIALFMLTSLVCAQETAQMPGRGEPPGQKLNEKGKRPPGNPDMMKMRIIGSFFLDPMTKEYLAITDEQSAKLEKMKADHGKRMIDQKSEVHKLMIDMHLLMEDSSIDVAAVRTILQKISAIDTATKIEGLNAFNSARAILTADQKTKLDKLWKGKDIPELKKMMKEKMGGRGEGEMEPPPPGGHESEFGLVRPDCDNLNPEP
jgi:Spy/CpxP family protein refolding chaperone